MPSAGKYGDPRVMRYAKQGCWLAAQGILVVLCVAIIAFALTGCSATMPEKPIVQTVLVEKPVPCRIQAIDRPTWDTERVNPDDPVSVSRSIRAELERRRGYEAQLEAAVKSCQ